MNIIGLDTIDGVHMLVNAKTIVRWSESENLGTWVHFVNGDVVLVDAGVYEIAERIQA